MSPAAVLHDTEAPGIIAGADSKQGAAGTGLATKGPDPTQLVQGTEAMAPHRPPVGVAHSLGELTVRNLHSQQNSGEQLQLPSKHF